MAVLHNTKAKGLLPTLPAPCQTFDATLERNFFGSRHGKGPSDGEAVVVKHHATSAIVAGKAVIATAQDLYRHCISSSLNQQPPSEGCIHFLRTFFWVGEDDVKRDREDRRVLTVPGTRSFHSVKSVARNEIMTRHLACSCFACCSGTGDCENGAVAGPWKEHSLRPVQQHCRRQQAPEITIPPASPDGDGPPASPVGDGPPASPDGDGPPASPNGDGPPASPVGDDPSASPDGDGLPASPDGDGPPASPDGDGLSAPRIQPGCWVEAKFTTDRNKEHFFKGLVLDIKGDDAVVKYLRQKGQFYVFPDVDDVSLIPALNLTILTPPDVNRRCQHFFTQ